MPQPIQQPEVQPQSSNSRIWLIVGIAIAAMVILGLLLAVLIGGSRSAEPLTSAAARDALIRDRDLSVPMTESTEPSSLTEDMAFDPDVSADCATVIGVSRLTDIDPGTTLGTPVFPREARDIEIFEGVNFEDTSEDYLSTVKQRIMVFQDVEQATGYMTAVEAALASCPRSTITSENGSITLTLQDRNENVVVGDGEISWTTASDFRSDDADDVLDYSFSSDKGKLILQRGPNVLVASYYRSDEDPTSIADFEASLQAAKDAFLKAVG